MMMGSSRPWGDRFGDKMRGIWRRISRGGDWVAGREGRTHARRGVGGEGSEEGGMVEGRKEIRRQKK
jgi:hypothetical protein